MTFVLPNGIGQALGDSLVTCEPITLSGNVWYVGDLGTDAASPAGRSDTAPLFTLAQAVTNAADHDIIVLLDGYSETLTTAQALSKKLTIVGSGQSGGRPTCKLKTNHGSNGLLTVSGTDVCLRNIWIEAGEQTNATAKITVSAAGFKMVGCYVECGATDTGPGLLLNSGADRAEIKNTTFISTGTAIASRPESAIKTGAALTTLRLDGLVLSGGQYGFSNYLAMDATTAAITRLEGESVSLLLGADIGLHANTVGYLNVGTSTGGARVNW